MATRISREEIIETLTVLERLLAARTEIWREVIAPDGTVEKRMYSGSFLQPKREAAAHETPEPPKEIPYDR